MMAFQLYQRHLLLFRRQNFLRFRSCRSTTKNQKKNIFSYFRVSRFSSLVAVPSAEVPIITSVVGRSTVRIHNLLHQGCLPYPKTWAYQLYLLNHRLEQRRRRQQQHDQQLQEETHQQQQQSSSDNFHDQDCVLLLEHSHVYTLGRGADETHLTFLQQQDDDDDDSFSSSDDKSSYSTSISTALQKLSRKARGEGTARLTLDRRMEDQMKTMMKNNNSIDHDDDNNDEKKSMLRIIEKLTESISPVVAPNDVPVYRVERGGEGKYSSVCMYVCVCVCVCVYVCVCLCVYTCSYIIFIKTNQSPHLINTKIKYATRKNTVYIYIYIYIYSHVSWSKTISCISHA
jgi:lipoate-protein ligase B